MNTKEKLAEYTKIADQYEEQKSALIEEIKTAQSQAAALLDVVRECVNFLAGMDNKTERSKALHKRAYTAHSKAKEK